MQYVVHRRLRCKSLSGAVNLPFGTLCTLNGEIIEKDGKPLFFATSENAHQYLARRKRNRARAAYAGDPEPTPTETQPERRSETPRSVEPNLERRKIEALQNA